MRLLLAVAWVTAVGCGGGEDDYLVERAQQVRELELLADVDVVRMSRDEFAALAEQDAQQISEAQLAEYAETYGRLGFFDLDLDLRPIIAGSSSEFVGATYWMGQITLVGDAPDDTIIHEWVHALQDQHFDDVFEPERFAVADDGEPVWVEVRGIEVTVLKNVDPNLMLQLADAAFAAEPAIGVTRASPSLAELVHSLHE